MENNKVQNYDELKNKIYEYPKFLKTYKLNSDFPDKITSNCITILQYIQSQDIVCPDLGFSNFYITFSWIDLNNLDLQIKVFANSIDYIIRDANLDTSLFSYEYKTESNNEINLTFIDILLSQIKNYEYNKFYTNIYNAKNNWYNGIIKRQKEDVNIYSLAIKILNFVKKCDKIRSPIGKTYPTLNVNTEKTGNIIFEFNDGEKTMDLEMNVNDKDIIINYKMDNGDDNIFDKIHITSNEIPPVVQEHISKRLI